MKYYLLLLISLLITSCKNSGAMTSVPGERDQTEGYRYIVSFFSPGNGTDHDINSAFLKFLDNSYSHIEFSIIKWGREGELDYCFTLKEMSQNNQKEFVILSNDILASSTRIRTFENSQMIHKKRN